LPASGILAVFGGNRAHWAAELVARLSEVLPDVYGGVTADVISAARAFNVASVDVRHG
jgi:hypothetical protein